MNPAAALHQALRRLRIALSGPGRSRRSLPVDERGQVRRACWAVRAFYLIILHFAFETQRNLTRLAASGREIDPLWPVVWIDQTHFAVATQAIGLAFLASALAAILAPERRGPRLLVAVFYLQALGLENSFGSINHYGHVGLWLALVFAALPAAGEQELVRSRCSRRRYLTLFFLAQALVALFYTSSGLRKAYYGVVVPDGAISSFAPDALPLLVVQKWLQTGDTPLLAGLFLEHAGLAWPVHLVVIYVELFALVAIFRPALHVLWGGMLIVFHLMVWLLLGISFAYQPVLIGLLFVGSPFVPRPHPRIRAILRELPLFGELAAFMARWWRGGAPRPAEARLRLAADRPRIGAPGGDD